jgi:DNA mismatch repair protein MutS
MKVQVNHNPAPRQLYFNFEEPVMKPVEEDNNILMIMKQFKDLKAKHPDALLLFRAGDFYTSLEEDAVKAADCLGIILTQHDGYKEAAFPHYALDTYLPKLIRCGFRVAICDQITVPKKGR